jgi:hypothetical protein
MRRIVLFAVAAAFIAVPLSSAATYDPSVRTIDGSKNNEAHPTWGQAGAQYLRVASPNYADASATPVAGPPARYVSNRFFNDTSQNFFSENSLSQWGWAWGQFMDHVFGLRDERELSAERAPIRFDASDPLERFRNDFGVIPFFRTPSASPAGPREQINTVDSYIDASNVYGDSLARLEWLRRGRVNGDLSDNSASLLLPDKYLPRLADRNVALPNPQMDIMGRLNLDSTRAVVAGDVRANENIALTAVHTLFAREHNRIVGLLPASLSEEDKFQIARRVVGAEEQYVTFTEFLPAMGIYLPRYSGYDKNVDATLTNEFAAVGYRAHSQIHGELPAFAPHGRYSAAQLASLEAQGVGVEDDGTTVTLDVPLNVAFGNPDLLQLIGLGPVLKGLGVERQYKNDEQIDNQLRSVLFGVPLPDAPDPAACFDGQPHDGCFNGVVDLGAIDIERGRDHGMPYYNDLRAAYGLPPKRSFADVTGEGPGSDGAVSIDDPSILEFTELRDANGNVVPLGSPDAAEDPVSGTRRSTVASRLRAIYGPWGGIDKLDAFVGMLAERHVPGTELGELQLAIWTKQFQALRDGDRFFYGNDDELRVIQSTYGIDYRHTLAEIVTENTNTPVQGNAFAAQVDAGGLVAAYGFDDGSGSVAADSSGHGNDGTTAATTWVSGGKFGGALSFNGTSSWVTVPDAPTLDLTRSFTLEAWVKPTALGAAAWRTVVLKEQPGELAYALYAHAAGPPQAIVFTDTEHPAVAPAKLALNAWSHLAATYDGANLALYVNGAQVASVPAPGAVAASQLPLRIGGNSIWSEWFKGLIDEVKVYNRTLPVDEIQADMATPVSAHGVVQARVAGDPAIEADVDPNAPGLAEAYPATAGTTGTVTAVRVYVDAASTATRLVAGVYDNAGGHPGSLLAIGSVDSPTGGAWNTVQVGSATLAAGTRYWIAVLGPTGSLAFRDRFTLASPVVTETSGVPSLDTLPLEWTRGTTYDDGPISAVAIG